MMASFHDYPSIIHEQVQNPTEQLLNENKNYEYIQILYIGPPSYSYAKKVKAIMKKT